LSHKKDKSPAALPAPAAPKQRYWIWVALVLIILAAAVVRLRLADLPLERDEGEYAYAGQLMLEGVPPYSQAYNMKFPGVYAAYAAMMALFGQTAAGIHIGLALVCAATAVLVFLLVRRLVDDIAGLVAAATYSLLAISPNLLALAGHATHFVMLAAVGGLLLLLRGIQNGRRLTFLWSGLCLGVSITMKQPAGMFLVFAGLYLVWAELASPQRQWKRMATRLGLLVAGAIAPLALMGLALWGTGVFDRFWFWTFTYAAQYGTVLSVGNGMINLTIVILDRLGSAWGLWLLAGLGLVVAAWDPKARWMRLYHANITLYLALAAAGWYCGRAYGEVQATHNADQAYASPERLHFQIALVALLAQVLATGILGLVAARRNRQGATVAAFGLGFFVAALVATSAGFYYREHYFILMAPVVALLAGAAVSVTRRLLAEAKYPMMAALVPLGVFAAVWVYSVHQQREAFFVDSPTDLSRKMYGSNPFPESLPLAEYLRANTSPEDRIAVLGSEPQIFFYAHRRSATGYIYTYSLMEDQPYAHNMQLEMTKEITTAQPKFIVFVSPVLRMSWLPNPKSDLMIFPWADEYLRRNYEVVGYSYYMQAKPLATGWQDWAVSMQWGQAAVDQLQQWEKLLAKQRQAQAGPATLVQPRWVMWDLPLIVVLKSKEATP
jgi:4-amino-4-deoxy-L-arabinose transferase-like glycosyltransferase